MLNGKYRKRETGELVRIIENGLMKTGYDAVTLAGLSAADYRQIVDLLYQLSVSLAPRRISVALPSMRADRFTLALSELIQVVHRPSITFASEVGTERLRRVFVQNYKNWK